MASLEIRLLGPPLVTWNGVYLAIPRRRARALLYRLAIEMQPVAREHLIYLFWANIDNTHAHRDLTHLLTHLRNAIPEADVIQTTADFVCLDARTVWSDTNDFLRLLRGLRAEATPEVFKQAASLCRGPLFDGFALDGCAEFEEWLTLERAVWERRCLGLLNTMGSDPNQYAELGMATLCTHCTLSMESLGSEADRRLMQSRLDAGDFDGVHRHWKMVRDLLVQEGVVGLN